MIKRIKVWIAVAVTILPVLLIIGCKPMEYSYTGEYPELFTIAINSILGTRGYRAASIIFNANIAIVDKDDYGRILFLYNEGADISTFSLVIGQKSDGEYVYFYPHHNFISISRPISSEGFGFISIERADGPYIEAPSIPIGKIKENFTAEAVEELKKLNDWNQPLNLERAIRAEIVDRRVDRVGPIDDRALRQAYDQVFGDDALGGMISSRTRFFITDNYGRSIYVAWGRERRYTVILFQPDGSFDVERSVMELHDRQQYQDELKTLKELNGWNESWEE